MTRWLFLWVMLLTPAVHADPPRQVTIGGLVWYSSYDEGLKVARQEGKPLWVHFGENPG